MFEQDMKPVQVAHEMRVVAFAEASGAFASGLRRVCAGPWERMYELACCGALAAGSALQVFGLVNGVAGKQPLGAQMGALVGAQSSRALSHGLLKGQPLVLRRNCRARFGPPRLMNPHPAADCAL
jgi:hypothetical protein